MHDGDALVAEYSGSGSLLARYVHGAGADTPLVWYDGGTVSNTTRRHLLADHQGSIIGLSDYDGDLIGPNRYDVWGVSDPSNIGRLGYTGQAYLGDIGLYYYRARMYAPEWGRFLQTDPIGYEDNLNLYAYVGNDPVNNIDPSGLATCRGTRTQCSAIRRAIAFSRLGIESSPSISPEARDLSLRAIEFAESDDYVVLFRPDDYIDRRLRGRGFSFTSMTENGTIFSVFPENFPDLFENYPDGFVPAAERAATVAHEASHGVDYQEGLRVRGQPFSRSSPTERRADEVEQSVRDAVGRICVGVFWGC